MDMLLLLLLFVLSQLCTQTPNALQSSWLTRDGQVGQCSAQSSSCRATGPLTEL